MWLVTGALILGVPWLAGRGLLHRLRSQAEGSGAGYAYPVGAVLIASTLGWLGLAGALRWPPLPFVLAAAGAAFLLGPRSHAKWSLEPAAAPAVALVLLLLLESAATPIGGYDAIAMWSAKARGFWQAGGVLPVMAWPGLPHADYPFLSSMMETWAYIVAGGFEAESLAKLHQPLLLGSLALALGSFLREARGRSSAVLFGTLVLATPILGKMATECWADLPLAVFNGLAAIAACRVLTRPEPAAWLVFGLMGGAMAATKLEGTLLFGAQVLGLVVAASRTRGWRPLVRPGLRAASIAFLVAAPWILARSWLDLHSEYGSDRDLGFAREGTGFLEHVGRIASYGLRYAVAAKDGDAAPGDHGLLFPYLVVTMLLFLRPCAAPAAKLAAGLTILQIAIHGAALAASPHLPSFQLPVTVDRLLLQIAPVAFLACALLTPPLSWESGLARAPEPS